MDKILNKMRREKLDLSEISESRDYTCPFCNTEAQDYSPNEYNILEYEYFPIKDYPKIGNFKQTFEGNLEWDEVHFCVNCRKEFYYQNGNC